VLGKQIKYLTINHTVPDYDKNVETSSLEHHYMELTVLGKLICGATTGIVAQTITYPVDVIRRHMQLDTMFKNAVERR
jgi:hypothetical protein